MSKLECIPLKIGFLVNPLAGAGGPAGHKGSDLSQTQELLKAGKIQARSPQRARQFLSALNLSAHSKDDAFTFITAPGQMGEDYFDSNTDLNIETLDLNIPEVTSAKNTLLLVRALMKKGVDMIIFVGGDGTARDVCSEVKTSLPVMGVPSGVKMHSGVFAITPDAAAKVLFEILQGKIVTLSEQDVRDIDEAALQHSKVKSRYFGSMLVPEEIRYMQSVKAGGIEVDELVLEDIAAEIEERIDDDENNTLFIFATGSTTHFIQQSLGCEATLLGVDVVVNKSTQHLDVDSITLEHIVCTHEGRVVIVLTAIGGQGHILGRGNQQLSPKVLKRVGRENLWLVITKTKLESLQGRPLLIDSNDNELDQSWQGLIPVITGYHDQVLYRLGCDASDA